MKILVVDDDQDILNVVKTVLCAHGHEVVCFADAAQAISHAKETEFEFILLDYKMPNNDGIWFMENIRPQRKTKILLITAYINREVINRMFALGISGYLVKPFGEEDLLRHIEFFCRQQTTQHD